MINPFQLATLGVGPGFKPFNMATSGFGFDIDIIIVPPQTGGGGGGTVWYDAKPYELIIRVTKNGKTWEERRFISPLMAKSLEKVLASFKSIAVKTSSAYATFKSFVYRVVGVKVDLNNTDLK